MSKFLTKWFAGAAIVVAIGSIPTVSFATTQITPEQRSACIGDAMRLCYSEISSMDRVIGCLTRQKPKLGARCRAEFDKAGR